jgi:predicted DNA-binding transcriptional regulator AlpA
MSATNRTNETAPKTSVTLPAMGYVRQSQLIPAIIPISSATLWREVCSGEFPKPVKLSARITAWRVEDVREWMKSRTTSAEQGMKGVQATASAPNTEKGLQTTEVAASTFAPSKLHSHQHQSKIVTPAK